MRITITLAFLLLAILACGQPMTTEVPIDISPTSKNTASVTPTLIPNTHTPPPATPTLFPDTPAPPILSFPTVEVPEFTHLYMINELDGWAISENAILRTNDGGSTWYDVSFPGETNLGNVTSFSYLNFTEAWVLVPESQDPIHAGTLYHTTDGGQTWGVAPVPFEDGKLDFVTSELGWMMANLGVGAGSMGVAIFQTADGGLAWNQVYTNDPNSPLSGDSLPLGGLKNNLVALDMQTAWVAGMIYAPDTIYLYKTTDDGKIWTSQTLPSVPEAQNSEATTDGPILLSDNYFILPVQFFGDTMQTGIYFSANGGQTWEFATLLPRFGTVDFTSPSDGFYWSGNDFFVSEDGGQTWTQITSNLDFDENLILFDFVNNKTGWAVTYEDGQTLLYKTVDGVANWVQLSP